MTPLFTAVVMGDLPLLTAILSRENGLGSFLGDQPSKAMSSGGHVPLTGLSCSLACRAACISRSMIHQAQLGMQYAWQQAAPALSWRHCISAQQACAQDLTGSSRLLWALTVLACVQVGGPHPPAGCSQAGLCVHVQAAAGLA